VGNEYNDTCRFFKLYDFPESAFFGGFFSFFRRYFCSLCEFYNLLNLYKFLKKHLFQKLKKNESCENFQIIMARKLVLKNDNEHSLRCTTVPKLKVLYNFIREGQGTN